MVDLLGVAARPLGPSEAVVHADTGRREDWAVRRQDLRRRFMIQRVVGA
jgi:hypothetical protein